MSIGVKVCWQLSIPILHKAMEKATTLLTKSMGYKSSKRQASSQRLTHGLYKICDMVVNMGMNAKQNCEDDGHMIIKDYACDQPIIQRTFHRLGPCSWSLFIMQRYQKILRYNLNQAKAWEWYYKLVEWYRVFQNEKRQDWHG